MSTPIAQALTVSGTEAAVCADIFRRQQLGIKKYGVSVAENTLPLRAWLQHAYEETLDQAVYLKRAMEELDRMPVVMIDAIDADRDSMVVGPLNGELVPTILRPGDKLAVMYHQAGN